jgi:hypothetical protein
VAKYPDIDVRETHRRNRRQTGERIGSKTGNSALLVSIRRTTAFHPHRPPATPLDLSLSSIIAFYEDESRNLKFLIIE